MTIAVDKPILRRRSLGVALLVFLISATSAVIAQGQDILVTGTITESSGATLPGVTVIEKGTTNSTVTDADGKYSLQVPSNATLIVSFIGFETAEILVDNKTAISTILKESVNSLDEVVVIGYGTTTKKEITGAVASLKTEDFNKGAFTDPMGMISGKVAGLSITQPNGADPQAQYQIMLRGNNTLVAGQGPLIIIDGVIGADLKNVNWQDIASFDVLKDGSAAAIYGTRGTNGVIIITTKSAKAGKPVLEYSGQLSVQVNPQMVKNLNADEFTEGIQKYRPELALGSLLGAKTNWFKEVTRSLPASMQHNLALSGGVDNFTYRTSLTYSTNQGLLKNNDANRILLKVNIHQKAFDKKLDLDFNLTSNSRDYKPANYDIFYQAFNQNPTQPVYDPTDVAHGGYYFKSDVIGYYNPVAMQKERKQDGKSSDVVANFRATLKVLPGLTWSNFISTQRSSYEANSYKTRYYPQLNGVKGEAEISNGRNDNSQIETTLNYQNSFGDHNLQVVGGYSYQLFEENNSGLSNSNFDTDIYGVNNIYAGTFLKAGTADMYSEKQTSKLVSVFGRVMYNYKEKYLVSVSAREEGSSKFGANHKYGLFPAVSAGWRMHEEDFIRSVSWINELKLRAGYGVTGNQDFGPYQSLLLLEAYGKFFYNGEWINSYRPKTNYNPNLRWEKKQELNVGVDFTLFGKKLSGAIDYYNRNATDLLYKYDVPTPPYLAPTIFTNVGAIRNTGIELMLNTMVVNKGNFTWRTIFTASHNTNKLVRLVNDEFPNGNYNQGLLTGNFPGYTQLLQEGKSIGTFYGPKWLGVDELGHDKFKNANPVGGVDPTKFENLGTAYPIVTLGWSNNISYKGFDLSATFRSNIGGKVLNTYRLNFESWKSIAGTQNIVHTQLDEPRFGEKQVFSSKYLESATFLKLDNITLGRNIPVTSTSVTSVYAFVSAQNVLRITAYKGLDPEVSMSGLSPGIDPMSYYPRTTTLTFGITAKFN